MNGHETSQDNQIYGISKIETLLLLLAPSVVKVPTI